MNRTSTQHRSQRGGVEGKILFAIVGLIAFFLIKSTFSPASASIQGKMDYELVSNFGEPVSKRTIPRPN